MVVLQPSGCTDVSVSVSFLVFADRTSIGDPRAINEIFEERERSSKAWTVILTALRAGEAAGGNREGIPIALQYLNSPNQEDFEQSDKRIMRRQLQAALGRGRGGMTIDQYLKGPGRSSAAHTRGGGQAQTLVPWIRDSRKSRVSDRGPAGYGGRSDACCRGSPPRS